MPDLAAPPAPAVLAASMAECRAIARRAGGSFAAGMRLCPGARRDAMLVVYAWTRTADDLADEPGRDADTRRADLAAFREQTRAALAGNPEPAGIWPAVSATTLRHEFDPRWCTELLAGCESDITPAQPETLEDLLAYCTRVASTVGLMCVRIWGITPGTTWSDVEHAAIRRGHALQLTNIVRDLGEDLADTPRRAYIPRAVLAEHAIDTDTLSAWSEPARCTAAVRSLTEEARRAWQDSADLDRMIDPACLSVLRAMSTVYARYLDALEADPKRSVLGPRVRISKARRTAIACRAWLASRAAIAAS